MTLKELVKNVDKEEVLEALFDLYPECESEKHKYLEVMAYLEDVPVKMVEAFVVEIGLIDPSETVDYEEGVDEESYVSISGYSPKEDLHFALGFTKWDEWANAMIVVEEDLMIAENELVAMCIYEMTFYGFDQESILKELADLEKGITSEMYH